MMMKEPNSEFNENEKIYLGKTVEPPVAFAQPQYPSMQPFMHQPQFNQIQTPQIISSEPVVHSCPYCGTRGITKTSKKSGLCSLGCGIGLFMIGLGLCSFIPCCIDECKDTIHACHKCNNVITIV